MNRKILLKKKLGETNELERKGQRKRDCGQFEDYIFLYKKKIFHSATKCVIMMGERAWSGYENFVNYIRRYWNLILFLIFLQSINFKKN